MIADIISVAVGALSLCIGVVIVAYRAGYNAGYNKGQIAGLDHARKYFNLIGRI